AFLAFGAVVAAALAGRNVERIHLDGDVAQHVFVDLELAFQLDHRRRRGIDVEEHIMPLAILLDAISEPAQAPIFLLLDFAAAALNDGLEMGGERVHRLRADILARDQEMLIKSHVRSLSSACGTAWGWTALCRFGSPDPRGHPRYPEIRASNDRSRLKGG